MAIQPSDYLSLSVDERRRLIDDIQASIIAETGESGLSPELEAELDRRVADADASPDDSIGWEEIKSQLQMQLRNRK